MGVELVGRGYAQYAPHSNQESVVFAIALGEVFELCRDLEDWHQDDRALPLVRQYQVTLDAVLRDAVSRGRAGLAECAVHCNRCGIRFLTHPRNAGREDLCCEFGCRELQRRELANARSKKHYQTAKGWRSKKLLNGKRSAATAKGKQEASPAVALSDTAVVDGEPCSSVPASTVEAPPELASPAGDPAAPVAAEEPPDENVKLVLEGFTLNEVMLVNSALWPYLAMVVSLLEGREIRPGELRATLRKHMRQRSFDRLPRRAGAARGDRPGPLEMDAGPDAVGARRPAGGKHRSRNN